ncbi:DUF202 domain-containing protein [Corynebacterium sp. A21]|uniref:DUF202 domain-containing protein n=1 Tax=Corynebacterium sp. A21 TaxID=3457318 RepID=UPI003FCF3C2F
MRLDTRPHADPGLQPERTVLSWTRTVVSLMIVSAILLRWSPYFPSVIYGVIALMAGLAITIYSTQQRRYARAGLGIAEERIEPSIGSVCLLTTAMLLFGMAGLALLVLELPHL